ncbi:hypothetical protein GJ631_02365, partial [Natronomonas sp. CBA1123]|uniref:integrin alpha n=1 Tax=Natronomonas sp. CBA1123 TaxID=2668070 RepID=UPI0012EA0C58
MDSVRITDHRILVLVLVTLLVVSGTASVVGFAASAGSADQTTPQQSHAGNLSNPSALADANATFLGNATNETAGYDVASGDVNNDSHRDVLIAAPAAENESNRSTGTVYLFYGPIDERELDVDEADVTFSGVPGDDTGWDIATGNLTGNGYNDIVIGAPRSDRGGAESGAVYIVEGDDHLPEYVNLSTDADAVYYGPDSSDRAGHSVATVAMNDSDGVSAESDGYDVKTDRRVSEDPDALLVGAPYNDSTADRSGAVYLVSNVTLGEHSLNDTAAVTYLGVGEGDRAGWDVGEAGDVNSDGRSEIIVGAPFNGTNGTEYGAAYVLPTEFDEWSNAEESADANEPISVSEGLTLEGISDGDRAGFSVSMAGNTLADDWYTLERKAADERGGEVLIGAPYNDSVGNDSGAVYVVRPGKNLTGNASLADANVTLYGEAEDDRAGWNVAGGDELICNGYDDILVGAPFNSSSASDTGAAYVVTGGLEAGERNLTGADGKLEGENKSDRAGWAVAPVGDVTGDEKADVLVGAPLKDSPMTDAGAVYLVAGDCSVKPKDEDKDKDRDKDKD